MKKIQLKLIKIVRNCLIPNLVFKKKSIPLLILEIHLQFKQNNLQLTLNKII